MWLSDDERQLTVDMGPEERAPLETARPAEGRPPAAPADSKLLGSDAGQATPHLLIFSNQESRSLKVKSLNL